MGLTWKHICKSVSTKRAYTNVRCEHIPHTFCHGKPDKSAKDQELGQCKEENKFAHSTHDHLISVVPCLYIYWYNSVIPINVWYRESVEGEKNNSLTKILKNLFLGIFLGDLTGKGI